MNKKTISMLTLGLLLGGGAIGAYQVAAQNNNVTSTAIITQQQGSQGSSYQGSITLDEAKYEGQSEQDESRLLSELAKITADEAKQVAETQVGGTVTGVELADKNGTLVYEISIGNQEVKVDAGDGTILKIEQDDNKNEGIENENEKSGDIEKDGIDHQFEGQEEHED